ncbi:MAG: tail fiber domain-containing protein [Candidatus Margulisiibacteriota bacterium]|jgi:hypothetical protein
MFKKILCAIFLFSLISFPTYSVPNQLTYSGRLLQNGALVNSTLTMTFKIWNDPTAGTLLWSTSNISVPVNQGIYSVALDQVSLNVFTGDNAYLEVVIDPLGTPETLAPRTKINSVGYALQAGGLTTSGGGNAVFVSANGNVGIGTTAPGAKLNVYKNQSNAADVIALVQGGALHINGEQDQAMANRAGRVYLGKSQGSASQYIGWFATDAAPYGCYEFGNNGNVYMGGSVGIGISTPTGKLQVKGTADLTNPSVGSLLNITAQQNNNNPGTQYVGMHIGFDDAGTVQVSKGVGLYAKQMTQYANQADFLLTTADVPRLTVQSAGNVGIGTTNPTMQLHQYGTSGVVGHVLQSGPNMWMGIAPNNSSFPAFFWDNADPLVFGTCTNPSGLAFSEKMRITAAGNVGIGMAAPTAKLDVAGTIRSTTYTIPASGTGLEMAWYEAGSYAFLQAFDRGTSTYKNLILGANGNQLFLRGDGNVGVGTSDPGAWKLYVAGSAGGTGSWNSSDQRWKKDILKIGSSLEKLSRINGVSYKWDKANFPKMNFDDGKQLGVIAQEVEAVYPELIKENSDGYKHLNYNGLFAPVIESIKELKAENEALKEANKAIIEENKVVKGRLELLEKK